ASDEEMDDAEPAATPTDEEELDSLDAAPIEEAPPARVSVEQLTARAKLLGRQEVRRILQSLLLVAERPVTLAQLEEATLVPADALQEGLQGLQEEWREGASGMVLAEVAEGWQLRTDPSNAEYVRRLLQVKAQ